MEIRLKPGPLLAALAATALGAATAEALPGAAGGGDPFFPAAGNGGYDVAHYGIRLRVDDPPARGGDPRLRARVLIRATATQRLSSFNLDLHGLTVSRVKISGAPVRFRRRGGELTIIPDAPLPPGTRFTAAVSYRGVPRLIADPDGSREGWDGTPDGAIVFSEPVGAPTWLPCNDRPTDKASFDFRISLPTDGEVASTGIANGRLLSVREVGGRRIWRWSEGQPMATYAATVAIGAYRLFSSRVGSIPAWTAIHRSWLDGAGPARRRVLRAKRLLPRILRFEQRLLGPYPFDATGLIAGAFSDFTYALETQTRPTFTYPPSVLLVVHEIAHQWFGDSLSVRVWPNIWLNEGFATYAEWIWRERHGGPSARATFRRLMRAPATAGFWDPPPGRPGRPQNLFDTSVYVRGAMTLEALRLRLGDRIFFRILRRWATAHRFGNVSTAQFILFAEREAQTQLDGLFQRWLYQRGKPVQRVSSAQ